MKSFNNTTPPPSAGTPYKKISLAVLFLLWLPPLQAQTVKDIEGNVYKTVTIGNQVWMAENLKVTLFNDGSAIAPVPDDLIWNYNPGPGYCWYNNDEAGNGKTYGALYNWYTVNTNKLCPAGWHVPTDGDWDVLVKYLGDPLEAGAKMKSTGGWNYGGNGNNSSGFSGLAGGYRNLQGKFFYKGNFACWWSATEQNSDKAWNRNLFTNDSAVSRVENNKRVGLSVRCLRN